MRTSQFVCSMSHAKHDIGKALEDFAFQVDAKQWTNAGIALGRIQELSGKLSDLARLASDPLWEESQRDRPLEAVEDERCETTTAT
jgi:hypothetical protein